MYFLKVRKGEGRKKREKGRKGAAIEFPALWRRKGVILHTIQHKKLRIGNILF